MIMPTYSIRDSMTQITGYPKSSVPGVSVQKSAFLFFWRQNFPFFRRNGNNQEMFSFIH